MWRPCRPSSRLCCELTASPDQLCNTALQACAAKCTADGGTCGGKTAVCDATAGYCVGCAASTDCPDATKKICDTAGGGQCVGCVANADCTADATKTICWTDKNVCVQCTKNEDCGDAGTCNQGKHECQ